MDSGYYLKSGIHWGHFTQGFGTGWLTCADEKSATRFESAEQATEALRLTRSSGSFDVVSI